MEISADVAGAGSSPQTQVGAGSARRWALALGSLTSFLVGLDALVVATALPTLHQEYGGGVEVLGWTVDAYQLAFAASILTGATLGDRFGRRQMFVCGVLVFTAASALCALSPTVEVLLAARAAQGVGGGLAVPLSVALIIDAVTPQERGRALGLWGAVTGVAVAAGPLVGGAVVEGLAWQWIFWLNVPVGALLAALAWWRIHESARSFTGRVDLAGVVLATAGVFAIAQALIRGESAGWTSASVAGGLLGGALILA
ncbi:MAG TPA: MFS transporter, partial [Pilimelia sp.]|nr:MFS transporter [Pilimelia sp.]